MVKKHLMAIDPAVIKPAIESYNRIALTATYHVSYHLPALYGMDSIWQFQENISGIIVMGSAASVHDGHKWQDDITDLLLESFGKSIPVFLSNIFPFSCHPIQFFKLYESQSRLNIGSSIFISEIYYFIIPVIIFFISVPRIPSDTM